LHLLNEIPEYQRLVERLRAGGDGRGVGPLGLLRSARPTVLAALQRDLPRTILVVTARPERATQLAEQLQVWSVAPQQVLRFPEPDTLPYERGSWSTETRSGRLTVLAALQGVKPISQSPDLPTSQPPNLPASQSPIPIVVVTSARALVQKTLPRREFHLGLRTLRQGQLVNLQNLLAHWVSQGYQPVSVVEKPGTFSRRGGIVDIFSPHSPWPVRIEFFGDEIDSLRTFDPATQRSRERITACTVIPAREAPPIRGPRAAAPLQRMDFTPQDQYARERWENDLEALAQGQAFPTLEFYLPYLYSRPGSLLDYLPLEGLVVVDDWEELEAVLADIEAQAVTLREELVERGEMPPQAPEPYFTWDALKDALTERHPLTLGYQDYTREEITTLGREEPLNMQGVFVPGPRYGGQLKRVLEECRLMQRQNQRVVLVTRQAPRLADLFRENLQPLWVEQDDQCPPLKHLTVPPPLATTTLVHGSLAEGWILRKHEGHETRTTEHAPTKHEIREIGTVLESVPLCVLLTDAEIFGWSRPYPRRVRRRMVAPEVFFADMQPGDYVVHVEHGIGIFRGLKYLTVQGAVREYLEVEYAGGDKLYVPVHQADRLSRYVGRGDRPPTIYRLGTADWARVKARAKRAVESIARELLELYSKREVIRGHAFSPDTPWQAELEASFPYIETEDQLKAIAEVKADMEKPRPMDRLICGDVGYGKTEVALRAAFKAVMDGKQVAVLVPTTVLAQQHYETFRRRLEPFPVEVEMLSRFRSRKEQQEILRRLREGTLDIVIGTHRLLSRDVAFKDLGLLIIDEEQRFGVTHKERLKKMRTQVDVLTLTATPIPRTLYMSLTGIRDMSTIDTPPEERLPIRTHVGEYDKDLVRRAIMREIDRGGQVYYVHNRVQTIHHAARRVQRLVPEATVAIAHGQMPERELEQVMLDFVAGKYDVLVCTTIIESGIDIPNVNTLIVDDAERYGLAQLYQLRGRVGRGAVRAYAYFFYSPGKLTEAGRRRLETILEASELGAGFSIAMRDLEIRGAGDLLGTRQHGHIAAVGFDLYCRLLAQAVRELKGEAPPSVIQPRETSAALETYLRPLQPGVQISLPIPALLPPDYVEDTSLRLQLYRRMAGLVRPDEIDDMRQELRDRFGELPPEVENLFYQLRLKVLAERAGVESIGVENGHLVLRSASLETVNRRHLQQRLGKKIRVGRREVRLSMDGGEQRWRRDLVRVLKVMAAEV